MKADIRDDLVRLKQLYTKQTLIRELYQQRIREMDHGRGPRESFLVYSIIEFLELQVTQMEIATARELRDLERDLKDEESEWPRRRSGQNPRRFARRLRHGRIELDSYVRVWSDEHHAYHRPNWGGYTTDPAGAGVWPLREAVAYTQHCGPEKQVVFERAETPAAPPAKEPAN